MYYFEDFQVGASFDLGQISINEEEMIAFARQYDPQPFHTSPDLAAQSPFGGLIASGLQTISLCMRLFVTGILNNAISMASPGVDQIRWPAPVRPDDLLSATVTVIEVKASRSRPEMGIVRFQWEMLNQRGEQVLTLQSTQFLGRKAQE